MFTKIKFRLGLVFNFEKWYYLKTFIWKPNNIDRLTFYMLSTVVIVVFLELNTMKLVHSILKHPTRLSILELDSLHFWTIFDWNISVLNVV